ncbi:type II toxin-antitoxin system RelE/ParE family toxin [Telmatobacter bradus]|uniref:type II toxin-antitoxin system RelE/ParE family toxin n=1 Tax=Telmatobacter bradus TaxID=474953 RepID=UPI003B43D5A1
MKVLWSASAIRHLHQVVEYIADDTPRGAHALRRKIFDTVERVGTMPFSGREGRVTETREAVVPGTANIVVYRVQEQQVEVIGIWHAAREWPGTF